MIFWDLFVTFLKIGAFSFGGGYTMIPFFEKEIAAHHWIAAADYSKMIAVAQIFPGPFAIDSSAYIGYQVAGFLGAVVASVALSLPSFAALVIITKFYNQFKINQYVQMTLAGVRPVIIALLISAVYIIGFQPLIRDFSISGLPTFMKGISLIAGGYGLLRLTKINPIIFILLFAAAGMLLF